MSQSEFEIPQELACLLDEADVHLLEEEPPEDWKANQMPPTISRALRLTLKRDKELFVQELDRLLDLPPEMKRWEGFDAEEILHQAYENWGNWQLHTRFHPRPVGETVIQEDGSERIIGTAELMLKQGIFAADENWYEDGEEVSSSIAVGVEMDGEWWEREFNKPAGIAYRKFNELGEEEETIWLPNWDHLKEASRARDALMAQLMTEIEKAGTRIQNKKRVYVDPIRDLERISKWAGLWARHGVLRDRGVPSPQGLKALQQMGVRLPKNIKAESSDTIGLDYRRYAEVVNEALLAACLHQQENGADRTAHIRAITLLKVTDPEKFAEVRVMADKLTRWAQTNLGKGFRAKAIQLYQKSENNPDDSEDILDRCGQVGEFMIDDIAVDLSDESFFKRTVLSIYEYDRAREKMPRPEMEWFRMSTPEVEEWLVSPKPRTPAFAKLEDLFSL